MRSGARVRVSDRRKVARGIADCQILSEPSPTHVIFAESDLLAFVCAFFDKQSWYIFAAEDFPEMLNPRGISWAKGIFKKARNIDIG